MAKKKEKDMEQVQQDVEQTTEHIEASADTFPTVIEKESPQQEIQLQEGFVLAEAEINGKFVNVVTSERQFHRSYEKLGYKITKKK